MRWLVYLTSALALWCAPLAAKDVEIEHAGRALVANLETAGDAWPGGPVVLMTHGTLAHGRMEIMATLQGLLREAGISSLAITLHLGIDRRHGMYPCETPHDHREADAIAEIDAWANWLRGQGVERLVLLGHSRGGNQTARYALAHDSADIALVALIAPATWDAAEDAAAYEKRYGAALAERLARAETLIAAGTPDAWLDTGFLYCPDTRATAATFASYYGPEPDRDTPAILERIAKPVVVYAGSADDVVPGLEARVGPIADGEKRRLVVIDGADHFFRDLYADEIVESLQELIEEH